MCLRTLWTHACKRQSIISKLFHIMIHHRLLSKILLSYAYWSYLHQTYHTPRTTSRITGWFLARRTVAFSAWTTWWTKIELTVIWVATALMRPHCNANKEQGAIKWFEIWKKIWYHMQRQYVIGITSALQLRWLSTNKWLNNHYILMKVLYKISR